MSHCGCVGRKEVGDERERGKERSHLSWLEKKESLRKSSWSSGVSAVFEGEEYSGQRTQDKIRYQRS